MYRSRIWQSKSYGFTYSVNVRSQHRVHTHTHTITASNPPITEMESDQALFHANQERWRYIFMSKIANHRKGKMVESKLNGKKVYSRSCKCSRVAVNGNTLINVEAK